MPAFPFSAIVGQEMLKRALLLGVIQPALGGVLIRGTKGVAKSTAVRALAALLPPMETVAGCPFQRRPGEVLPDWPLPDQAATVLRPVPLVELPLGATEDRVLGSLHLERALRGERALEPGLLAAANRGLLYVDEVNLLPDHLVDILLDVAASGVHRLEREGLSLSHPCRFVLVGTMNPEEGDLRPQLLDRFGLAVDVADLADPADRTEAVRRRLAYEADPEGFVRAWQAAEAAESARLVQAQQLLPQIHLPDTVLRAVSERCLAAGVEGLRADLRLCQAACAWAAYQGRREVKPGDVEAVAELALLHRRTRPPDPGRPGEGGRESDKVTRWQGDKVTGRGETGAGGGVGSAAGPNSSGHLVTLSPCHLVTFETAGLFAARPKPRARGLARARIAGRWPAGAEPRRGPRSGPVRAGVEEGSSIAWAATLRAAAPHQQARGRSDPKAPLFLRSSDWRSRPRRGPVGCLLLFVVDASGSMAAWRRMRQTKSAVLALLVRAYQRRDRVALLAFRGQDTELVLPPSRGLRAARKALEELAVGGTTPLAHGVAAAHGLVRAQLRRQPQQPIWTVLLTDGRSNVSWNGSGDPWRDVCLQGYRLSTCGTDGLVVDTETGWPRFGRAAELARILGYPCLPLEEVLGRPLPDHWQRAV